MSSHTKGEDMITACAYELAQFLLCLPRVEAVKVIMDTTGASLRESYFFYRSLKGGEYTIRDGWCVV